jgi:hypothetical protein
LPVDADGRDGKHVIAIKDALLLNDDWEHAFYPFSFSRYAHEPRGFGGHCLAEKLAPLQREFDIMTEKLARSMKIVSTSRLMVPRQGHIEQSYLTSDDDDIVEYDAPHAPVLSVNPAQHPQFIEHYWKWYATIFEVAGVSHWSATSQRPVGMEHAPGMQLMLDVESLRHARQQEGYEQYYVELAKLTVEAARALSQELADRDEPPLTARFEKDETFEEIAWEDVDLERDRYVIKCYPTNYMAKTPGAAMQQAMQMIQSGMLSGPQALATLRYPDLEAFQSLESAAIEEMDMVLDEMIYDGTRHDPEPWQVDLPMLMQRAHKRLLLERTRKTPADRIELVWHWIEQAKRTMDAAQADQEAKAMAAAGPAANPPPMITGGPPPGEVPPPDSNILPMVAGGGQ